MLRYTWIEVWLAAAQMPYDLGLALCETVGPAVVGVETQLDFIMEITLSLLSAY